MPPYRYWNLADERAHQDLHGPISLFGRSRRSLPTIYVCRRGAIYKGMLGIHRYAMPFFSSAICGDRRGWGEMECETEGSFKPEFQSALGLAYSMDDFDLWPTRRLFGVFRGMDENRSISR